MRLRRTGEALLALCALLTFGSCAGYQLGGDRPEALRHVSLIHVPLAKNSTQIPRGAAIATNSVVDALLRDGTYGLGTARNAQATLEVDFFTVDFEAIRTARENRLRAEEFAMTVILKWKVIDAANPLKVLDSGTSEGRTSFFVDANLQTARQSSINDAMQRASISMIARIADHF